MESEANNQSTVPKKGPNDFIFGRVLGDGSFSTVTIHCFHDHFPIINNFLSLKKILGLLSKGHTIRERICK